MDREHSPSRDGGQAQYSDSNLAGPTRYYPRTPVEAGIAFPGADEDTEEIAELLGHEDTRTTKRYPGINDDDKLAATRVIDEVFG